MATWRWPNAIGKFCQARNDFFFKLLLKKKWRGCDYFFPSFAQYPRVLKNQIVVREEKGKTCWMQIIWGTVSIWLRVPPFMGPDSRSKQDQQKHWLGCWAAWPRTSPQGRGLWMEEAEVIGSGWAESTRQHFWTKPQMLWLNSGIVLCRSSKSSWL